MTYINRVFKHREKDDAPVADFHRRHHHGPYVFADAPRHQRALPADGVYRAMGYRPSKKVTGPTPLVVPSLPKAMVALGVSIRATSAALRDSKARARVETKFGIYKLLP